MLYRISAALCCVGMFVGWVAPVWAVPGPDSVAVVANADVKESVDLANVYAKARQIPANQICLLKLPTTVDISYADYDKLFLKPFEACLKKGGVLNRIEAVALMRGVPLRVSVTGGRGSLAAVLGMWKSVDDQNKPAVGQPVGYRSRYLAASWRNPFNRDTFRPGWSGTAFYTKIDSASGNARSYRYTAKPLLVTMLHGRSYKDAEKLLQSALDAEKMGGAKGSFLLMKGRDSARGVRDVDFKTVISEFQKRGFNDIKEVPFGTDYKHPTPLASFIVGTATLGKAIEDNTYRPGSLTDNLTSFGAVPKNFQATGQSQVSIARWVAKGVAGSHGTTDEPLNNVFPNRRFLVDYIDGSTLAEAYHRRMPYVYWRNLVLGDPMAAPYAKKPTLTITGLTAGTTVAGAVNVTIKATDPEKRGIASITVFADGKEVAKTTKGDTLTACVVFPDKDAKDVQFLVVAQAAKATSGFRIYQPKGWKELLVDTQVGGPKTCQTPEPPSPEPPTPEPVSEPPTQEPPAPSEPVDPTDAGGVDAPGTGPDLTPTDTGNPTDKPAQPADQNAGPFPPGPDTTPDTGSGADTNGPSTGCGCQSTSPASGAGLFLLFFFALVMRIRRTR